MTLQLCLHRQRKKRLFTYGGGGGEEFSEKFAPPLVLFMAEEQTQQLQQHTRQVTVDSVPTRWHFEYVLDSNSSVNNMLETALR